MLKNWLRRNSNRLTRAVVMGIAILCLWMATVGVLCHTDDFQLETSTFKTQVIGHGVLLPIAADACTACEWLAGILASVVLFSALMLSRQIDLCFYLPLTSLSLRRSTARYSTRAPPACCFCSISSVLS
jgi:hypothetical protein